MQDEVALELVAAKTAGGQRDDSPACAPSADAGGSSLMGDVVVVGSGGAGLLAACVAADRGLSVTVLERSPVLGGSTAVSGGMIWMANNDHMSEVGGKDSPQEALDYLSAVTLGRVRPRLLEAYVETAPDVVRYLESATPARFRALARPDYHLAFPGGQRGGRTLDNLPFTASALGHVADETRVGAHVPRLTAFEQRTVRLADDFDHDLVAQRTKDDVRTGGAALALALVAACVDRGISFRTNARATGLVVAGSRVVGVQAVADGAPIELPARNGVVLAAGGFEWNQAMKDAFLAGPDNNPLSPPWNEGDAIQMGLRIGAMVDQMTEAWWMTTFRVPGESYDGKPMGRMLLDERALPGSIMVNKMGYRFVNEAINYSDVSKAFHVFDPRHYELTNLPAWLVFDSRFKARYRVANVAPAASAPDWFARGRTIEQLAGEIGVEPSGLRGTIRRFNRDAKAGDDSQFGRGSSYYERYHGDESNMPNACLAPIAEPPYYAVEVIPGSLGTKGGLVTDHRGRVLNVSGGPIPGLMACGNTSSSVMGPGYPGAGATLGAALTFAYLCGQDLAMGQPR